MTHVREKFATQVDKDLLAEIRRIAKDEGRQLQSVVEDALRAHVEERNRAKPRRHVIDAYRSSLPRFGALYEKLAK
jgi:metal-responsive CopG/Arc/MetJ family transcriptional regulator